VAGVDDIRLTSDSDRDLAAIGGSTERDLFGKLLALPAAHLRRETRELEWQEAGRPVRYSWRIGAFTVVFHVHTAADGRRIHVIEGVVLTRRLRDWAEQESLGAARRDAAIAKDEREGKT